MPEKSELIGEWQLTEDSIATLKSYGHTGNIYNLILLNEDKFQSTNFPIVQFGDSIQDIKLKFITSSGYWSLQPNMAAWRISLNFSGYGVELDIRSNGGKLILSEDLADPDNPNRLEFLKIK